MLLETVYGYTAAFQAEAPAVNLRLVAKSRQDEGNESGPQELRAARTARDIRLTGVTEPPGMKGPFFVWHGNGRIGG